MSEPSILVMFTKEELAEQIAELREEVKDALNILGRWHWEYENDVGPLADTNNDTADFLKEHAE